MEEDFPGEQSKHKPPLTEYLAAAQLKHVAAPALELIPAVQLLQEDAPTPEILPAAQVTHSEPGEAEKVPAEQSVHDIACNGERLPAGQLRHGEPATGAYFAIEHLEQSKSPGFVENPALQDVQIPVVPSGNFPSSHTHLKFPVNKFAHP
jgi:hypothetical protein